MTRRLLAIARERPEIAVAAARAEWELTSTKSQDRTPVETGDLRRSHRVDAKREGTDIVATITVGGPAASYAVFVHENLQATHPVGQAKFLESAVTEDKAGLISRLAKRMGL